MEAEPFRMPSKRTHLSARPKRVSTHRNPGKKKNFCFVCGLDNRDGMHLRFEYDPKRKVFLCRFRLAKRYTGPPGYCHGGIIATILDDAMAKLNKVREVVAVTSQMTVNYLKPVPLHKALKVESHEVSVRGRRHVYAAGIIDQQGRILARSRGLFIAIDPKRVFVKPEKK
jgi:uncharacterized protein (TIGR00369 family)